MEQGCAVKWKAWGLLALPFLLFVLGVAALKLAFRWSVSDATYFATGVAIVAYTVVTWKMRLEMVRQNEIAIQPLVIAGIEKRSTKTGSPPLERQVVLRNIGRGPALYVQVEDIKIGEIEDIKIGEVEWSQRLIAKFNVVDYVEEKKDAVADVTFYFSASGACEELRKTRWDFVSNLDPKYASKSYQLIASYEDVSGQRYRSTTLMGKGGIRLLGHDRLPGRTVK